MMLISLSSSIAFWFRRYRLCWPKLFPKLQGSVYNHTRVPDFQALEFLTQGRRMEVSLIRKPWDKRHIGWPHILYHRCFVS